ncbi:MAG: hypothetical protein KBC83_04225 [Candidatus Moranbacteria bacterium]|jgi:hypothetical protein|nr:hypothetical protein [Candidatus Moranbacteria bacterium]MBP9801841.1 hypothetical protein [Candidatus Moranbacteria bacterium]
MKKTLTYIRKYKKWILCLVFLLTIASIFWTFLTNFGLGESEYNFLGKTKKITLSSGTPITQTFTTKKNGFHQIRVVLGRANIKPGEQIEFRLMDEVCQETLAMKIFHSEPPSQGSYTLFPFPVIIHSENQHYCFSTTYFSDEDRHGEKPYLSATDVPQPVFFDRTLTDTNKNKVYYGQTLFLRPAYTSGHSSGDLWTLVERLSQYKPEFLKDSVFLAISTIFLFVTIVLGIRLIRIQD